jgi:hypothetical protein
MYAILFLAMISSSVGRMNENVVEILSDVTRHIHAGCVYLLHGKDSGKWFSDAALHVTDSLQIMHNINSHFQFVFLV